VPNWLSKQLMQAFQKKDRSQIRFLNRCWFTFIKKEYDARGIDICPQKH
jgi:hypothetical protein